MILLYAKKKRNEKKKKWMNECIYIYLFIYTQKIGRSYKYINIFTKLFYKTGIESDTLKFGESVNKGG
jgi:hypothetical protein